MRKLIYHGILGSLLILGGSPFAGAELYKTDRLVDDGIHDPGNDTINILQEPGEAMVDFPMDRRGKVDWVKALREGKIKPLKSLPSVKGEPMTELDMDVIMKQTSSMAYVRFPHLAHTEWLTCSNCHPDIFVPQVEGNNVSMEKILKGEFCGRCHDKVAFSLWTCERCHSVPQKPTPASKK